MKKIPDTRSLFANETACKPQSWADCPTPSSLDAKQVEALSRLPLLVAMREPSTDFIPAGCIECIAAVADTFYYVNSEGYSYARYAFRVPAWAAKSITRA